MAGHSKSRHLPAVTSLMLLATCLLASIPASAGNDARAITGDVIELDGNRYCLFGVDAPDRGQHCALRNGKTYDCSRIATTALMDLLAGAAVHCAPTGAKRMHCEVARCAADGFDLSGNMVHTGWALADPVEGESYLRKQELARSRRQGLWRGTFETPWKWRNKTKRQK